MLQPGEQLDDLMCGGLRIIQKKKGFHYGTDAVLLASFAVIPRNGRVADLGTGSGILPLLLSHFQKARLLVGVEIQANLAELARRNVALNGLTETIRIVQGNLKDASSVLGRASFEAVISNPPYQKWGSGLRNKQPEDALARHEIACTLDDVIRTAAELLVPGGHFSLVHRPERLADVIECLRREKLEPKEIQFVSPARGRKPNLMLLHAVRQGGKNLTVLATRYLDEQPAFLAEKG